MSDEKTDGPDEPGVGWVVAEITNLNHFIDACAGGLQQAAHASENVRSMREVDEVLRRPDRFGTAERYEEAQKRAVQLEQFSKPELKLGFPYLYGLAAIRLWAIVESAVDDLVVDLLLKRPETRQAPGLQKLKGPLVPFLASSPQEQAEYLAELLKQEVRASLHSGAGRFEAVLGMIELGGAVSSEVRRLLLELSEIRHVLVHRRGVADAKLVKDRCPWLRFKIGEVVTVGASDFRSYCMACDWYILELDRRLCAMYGRSRLPRAVTLQEDIESKLNLMRDKQRKIKAEDA